MTAWQGINPRAFQRAMIFSVTAHVILFAVIIASAKVGMGPVTDAPPSFNEALAPSP